MDEGDWLRVGQLFLPKSLGGFAVLHSKGSKKRVAKNGAAPQYVDCLMTWPTCSDFAALEAESSHCSASSSVRSTGEASAHEAPRKIPISEVCSAVAMAAACPSHGWQYLDQTGSVQGPFSLDEMRHWNRKGYFRADLLMRCHPEDSFVALAALFPAPLVPFQSHPKRPRRAPRSKLHQRINDGANRSIAHKIVGQPSHPGPLQPPHISKVPNIGGANRCLADL